MKTSEAGIKALKLSEGFREYAYPDVASLLHKRYPKAGWGFRPAAAVFATLPASAADLPGAPWTVGFGQTVGITQHSRMTPEQAEENIRSKLPIYERAVLRNLTVPPTQGQFDALVNLAWNVMSAVSAKSSIIKAHNRMDWPAASRAFGLYNQAKGVEEKGLTLRRREEGTAYLLASPKKLSGVQAEQVKHALPEHPVQEEAQPLVSQSVDEERPMAKSQINIASTAAGGTAAVAAAAEVVNSISAIKMGVSDLTDWAIPLLLIAVVGLCVYIVIQRNRQRREGWA